jgi:hypothetical protein
VNTVKLIDPPKIGRVYRSYVFVQFKKAEKYAFPTSKNIIHTKTLARRKKLIVGISGNKIARRKNRKIIPAETKIIDICKRIGSSFCLKRRKNDTLFSKEKPAVSKSGIPSINVSKSVVLFIS